MDNFVADLKKKSNIEVHEENLSKVVIDTGAGGGPRCRRARDAGAWAPPGMPPGMRAGAPPPGTPATRPVPQGKP